MTKKESLQKEASDLKIKLTREDGSDKTIKELEADIAAVKTDDSNSGEKSESKKSTKEEGSLDKIPFTQFEKVEKKVETEAAEIETVKKLKTGAILTFGEGIETVTVDEKYVKKHDPRSGGFYTRCKEGCIGYISKNDFQDYNEVEKK